MKKTFLWLLLVLLAQTFSVPDVLAVEVGSSPPDFQLTALDGKVFRLSDHRGERIILKLATTWCPSCLQQNAELKEASRFLEENGIRLVEVFLQDSESMVREYLAGDQFRSPFDAMIDDGQVVSAYHVYLIPRVLLIDRDFRVLRDGANLTAKEIEAVFGGR